MRKPVNGVAHEVSDIVVVGGTIVAVFQIYGFALLLGLLAFVIWLIYEYDQSFIEKVAKK